MHLLQVAIRAGMIMLAVFVITIHGFAQSNEGQDFWLAFMEHFDINQNSKVVMITSKYNTSGEVSVPQQNWSQSFSVTANSVKLITLPTFTETLGSEQVEKTGVHVTAVQPVSVYMHQYANHRSEASVVLPVPSIDKEYYVMAYTAFGQNNQIYPSEFIIVAIEDDTQISVTVSDNTKGGRDPGSTFQITLDAGETYQVQSAGGSDDLTGSHVVGDKDFAVFAGCRWSEVPAGCGYRDNLLEQMYAVSTWGRQFVAAPFAHMNYNKFRIMAAEDNTSVQVTGSTMQNYTLDAGAYVEFNAPDDAYILSDKAILVAQYILGNSCSGHWVSDPSMLLLNSIEQTRDTVTLYNSGFQAISENYINVIFSAADAPFITFDGDPLEDVATVSNISGHADFAYATLSVNSGAHTLISEGCGVIATAYGYGDLESYAYSGGASFKKLNANPIPEGGCLNDTLNFDTGLSSARYTFRWDLGDGTTSTESAFSHIYSELGSYAVQLILTDECLQVVDTFRRDVLITLRQQVEVLGDVIACEGASISLGATDLDGAHYEWIGPGNYFSEAQFPVINNASPAVSGVYEVIGIISGCATFPATSTVEAKPNPVPDLGPDTVVCTRNFATTLTPGAFYAYRWQNGTTQPSLSIREGGIYRVTVTDEFGCTGADEVELLEVCPTAVYVPNAFSPNRDGINDEFRAYGTDIISVELRVFSRWGELIFESTELKEGWDGKIRDRLALPGVYTWMLQVEGYRADGTVYTEVLSGDVLLVR